MILRASQKINVNGWRKQMIVDFDNKKVITGAFLFHGGDIDDLSGKQYKQMIQYFINQGFEKKES